MTAGRRSSSERGQLDLFRTIPCDFAPRDAHGTSCPIPSSPLQIPTHSPDRLQGRRRIDPRGSRARIWHGDHLGRRHTDWAASQIVEARDKGFRTSRLMAATPYEIPLLHRPRVSLRAITSASRQRTGSAPVDHRSPVSANPRKATPSKAPISTSGRSARTITAAPMELN